jgi:raffinose/stachyose/melibiose transport system permease protein
VLLAFAVPALRAEMVLDIPIHAAGYGSAFFEETARRFETMRPGVKVRLYGDPRIADKVRVRAMGGNYPDATTAELAWPQLIAAGRVADLAPWLEGPNWEGDARWADTFSPGTLESWRLEGRTYGIPFACSIWTVFYNKKLFREHGIGEPRTWDEFLAACETLRTAGIAPIALPGMYLRSYGEAFLRAGYFNLAGQEGWRRLGALAPGAYADPKYIRAAALAQRIASRELIAGWEGLSHTGAQLIFLEGKAAMTISGSWFVNEMKGRIPAGFELGAMNFPVWADGAAEPSAIQTSSEYFFLFKTGDPERVRATVDFFRYLTSRERAEAFAKAVDSPVALRSVRPGAYSPLMRSTAEIIGRARDAYSAPPNMLVPPGLLQAMTDARLGLFTGKVTPRQYGERLERAAEDERNRGKNPDSVSVRHPVAGTLLLLAMAALAMALLWGKTMAGLCSKRGTQKSGTEAAAGTRPSLSKPGALGFAGPAFLLYGLFTLLPGLVALAWSFAHWDGLGEVRWAGLFNFKWLLFESDAFWLALRNNLFLVVVPALAVVPVSLSLACLIHRGVKGAGLLRAVLLFPNLLGGIAATLLWMSAYEPHGGLVNAGLASAGQWLGLDWLKGFAGHPWLSAQNLYWSMIPIYVWMACGFNLVLYLAAMEGIDQELYEAASIDGATPLRQFFSITLPQIREVVGISVVFIVIGGLNAFEMVWLMTSQDPTSETHTMGTLLVTTMFKESQIGRATAIATVMLVLVLGASALVLRHFKAGDEQD